VLQVATGASLDFETATFHDIVVRATDGGGLSIDQVLRVEVTNQSGLFVGTGGDDTLAGSSEDDVIRGLGGNDVLGGSPGGDSMEGGLGDDLYIVNSSLDQIVEHADEGTDTVRASIDYALPANVEHLVLDGSGNIDGTGNALANHMTGNAGDNRLDGGDGNDTLRGRDGNDVLDGGLGGDWMFGGTGNDTVLGGDGNDILFGDGGDDLVDGGAGNDLILAGLGADTFLGGDGNDVVRYSMGEGSDSFAGGDGTDRVQLYTSAVDWVGTNGTDWTITFADDGVSGFASAPGEMNLGTGSVWTTLFLNANSSGTIHLKGGATIAFTSVEQIFYDKPEAPVVAAPIADQTATEDSPFSYTAPSGTFTDPDAGEVLTYSATLATGAPLPGWLSFDAATRTFVGTPTNDHVGVVTLRVTATGRDGLGTSDDFTLTIANTNDAPTWRRRSPTRRRRRTARRRPGGDGGQPVPLPAPGRCLRRPSMPATA
jgi:hypothetical protein